MHHLLGTEMALGLTHQGTLWAAVTWVSYCHLGFWDNYSPFW